MVNAQVWPIVEGRIGRPGAAAGVEMIVFSGDITRGEVSQLAGTGLTDPDDKDLARIADLSFPAPHAANFPEPVAPERFITRCAPPRRIRA